MARKSRSQKAQAPQPDPRRAVTRSRGRDAFEAQEAQNQLALAAAATERTTRLANRRAAREAARQRAAEEEAARQNEANEAERQRNAEAAQTAAELRRAAASTAQDARREAEASATLRPEGLVGRSQPALSGGPLPTETRSDAQDQDRASYRAAVLSAAENRRRLQAEASAAIATDTSSTSNKGKKRKRSDTPEAPVDQPLAQRRRHRSPRASRGDPETSQPSSSASPASAPRPAEQGLEEEIEEIRTEGVREENERPPLAVRVALNDHQADLVFERTARMMAVGDLHPDVQAELAATRRASFEALTAALQLAARDEEQTRPPRSLHDIIQPPAFVDPGQNVSLALRQARGAAAYRASILRNIPPAERQGWVERMTLLARFEEAAFLALGTALDSNPYNAPASEASDISEEVGEWEEVELEETGSASEASQISEDLGEEGEEEEQSASEASEILEEEENFEEEGDQDWRDEDDEAEGDGLPTEADNYGIEGDYEGGWMRVTRFPADPEEAGAGSSGEQDYDEEDEEGEEDEEAEEEEEEVDEEGLDEEEADEESVPIGSTNQSRPGGTFSFGPRRRSDRDEPEPEADPRRFTFGRSR